MIERQEARRQFIEDAGDLLEGHGLPHMAGRVLGALLICVPPQMSMDELAKQLQASKGSISSMTKLLLRLGIIEKISRPGHRKHYYQYRPNVWTRMLAADAHIAEHLELVQSGLKTLEKESEAMKQRLLEMKLFFEFMNEEMPRFLNRWEQKRKRELGLPPSEPE